MSPEHQHHSNNQTSRQDILDVIEETRNRMKAELSPDQHQWITEFMRLELDYHVARVVEVIAAHLPGMAPTIRALALHAENDDPESGGCGLPPTKYGQTL